MNEAMLTGESIPVIKAGLPNIASQTFCQEKCGKYVLSGGTGVVQTRPVGSTPLS
jgi:magnesium-transporting ATPase (P-type)